jgi:acyl carrier protein
MPTSKHHDKLRDIICENLGVTPEQVTPEARFVEDLGADSLDEIELVIAIEEEFVIDIQNDDAECMKTVQEALDYLDANADE